MRGFTIRDVPFLAPKVSGPAPSNVSFVASGAASDATLITTIAVPGAGAHSGKFALLWRQHVSSSVDQVAPSGWTDLVHNVDYGLSWKVLGSETTVTFATSTSAVMVIYDGVVGVSLEDSGDDLGPPVAFGAVTGLGADSAVLLFIASDNDATTTITSADTFTKRIESLTTAGVDETMMVADYILPSAGDVASASVAWSGASAGYAQVVLT